MAKQPFTNDSKGRVVVFLPLKVKICLFRSHGGLAVKGVNGAPWTMVANGGKCWEHDDCFYHVFYHDEFLGRWKREVYFLHLGVSENCVRPMANDDEPKDVGRFCFQTNSFRDRQECWNPSTLEDINQVPLDAFLSLLVVSEKAGFRLAKFHLHSPNPWLDYSARIHLVAANGPF